ncbi:MULTISPECIES: metalloregulator ArsR/SmtB family transcription factor [Shewanella]|uniref:metalloregulator ArsR/SmtB family transcription factor n=1 Tax=Shewanella TaxID=22 RepID=UPI00002557D3|nr:MULTISPECIES: metalloregulator ArsR/SmtB family transcription factor [unclassified Shewanella]ABK46772.1 transcriptional regulator, ArsR family [Shewanella sp. ANA-3]MDH0447129.1 metalloregulator ArsR/SmtB family transcription factor [Shewanella sp. GD04112]QYJ71977.1 metalloregulator ArsR/SmtB family transcription factor [Shewanella sp. FJAT-51649]
MQPVAFFKALADETRLKCLLLIQREGELCVCELMAALSEIQPKISRHLAQLKKAGILVDRRQGQWVFYQINPELNAWCQQVLAQSCEANSAFLAESMQNLCSMGARPERAKACC